MYRFINIISAICVTCNISFAQVDTIYINNERFITTISHHANDLGSADTVLNIYRLEGGFKKYILKHCLYRFSGDCNNEFTDKGSYYIEGNKIIFIEKYFQKGHDPIPVSRKQVYLVTEEGQLQRVLDKYYY